jgi:hypothetical protein
VGLADEREALVGSGPGENVGEIFEQDGAAVELLVWSLAGRLLFWLGRRPV